RPVGQRGEEGLEVLEVLKYRAQRHAGSLRDASRARPKVALLDEREQRIDDGGAGPRAAREPAVHLVDRRQRGEGRRHAGRNLLQSECRFNTGGGRPRPGGGGGAGRRLAIRPAACPPAEDRRSESSRGRSGWSASRSASGGSGSTASG